MALLEVRNLTVRFDRVTALDGISLDVAAGEIVTLIGANGAGKTTTVRTISGLTKSSAGSVRFDGRDLAGVRADAIVRAGIGHSPEGRRLFPKMSVRENLELGAYTRSSRAEIAADTDRVLALFPRLKDRYEQRAGTMSGGEQQMLAIGRALMARPRLLMLDEPSMGIAPILVQRIYETIAEINRSGVSILLVEQNANYALDVARRGYVLETGRVVLADDSSQLRNDPEVQRAYLGA